MSKLPDWFEGEVYDEGAEVYNKWTGKGVELNASELCMYDFIMGCNVMIEMGMLVDDDLEEINVSIKKASEWFSKSNPKAHLILFVSKI